MVLAFSFERARKGRTGPSWHNRNEPAAERRSNPCDQQPRSGAEPGTSLASGVDWLVSGGHQRTGVSPSDSLLHLTKGGESNAMLRQSIHSTASPKLSVIVYPC